MMERVWLPICLAIISILLLTVTCQKREGFEAGGDGDEVEQEPSKPKTPKGKSRKQKKGKKKESTDRDEDVWAGLARFERKAAVEQPPNPPQRAAVPQPVIPPARVAPPQRAAGPEPVIPPAGVAVEKPLNPPSGDPVTGGPPVHLPKTWSEEDALRNWFGEVEGLNVDAKIEEWRVLKKKQEEKMKGQAQPGFLGLGAR